VLNAYERKDYRYIIMEFIKGQMLDRAWPYLAPLEQSIISSQLKDYMRQMRQIRPPGGTRIGSVAGGPTIDRRPLSVVTGRPR
jgi:hypothetical protein